MQVMRHFLKIALTPARPTAALSVLRAGSSSQEHQPFWEGGGGVKIGWCPAGKCGCLTRPVDDDNFFPRVAVQKGRVKLKDCLSPCNVLEGEGLTGGCRRELLSARRCCLLLRRCRSGSLGGCFLPPDIPSRTISAKPTAVVQTGHPPMCASFALALACKLRGRA